MKLILAPMEGLVDARLRKILTAIGGIDQCVTEFIRVNDRVLPSGVFHRLAPELRHAGLTESGVPVAVQLLGSNPETLAGSALKAVALGASTIDLNFGCPSKTVNKSKGGAVLLKEPDLVHTIVKSIRQALPHHIPVTAKMRLGYDDKSLALDNAWAIEEGGAAELCVHARTKVEGYRPPAHWEWIARIREQVNINVVANGDICSFDDYQRCREISGCSDVMIGRGLIANPDLANEIKAKRAGETYHPLSWSTLLPFIHELFEAAMIDQSPRHAPGRLKQWLIFLKKTYPEASQLFDEVKSLSNPYAILERLQPVSLELVG